MIKKSWFLPLAVFFAVAVMMLATAPFVPDTFGERFTSTDDLERPLIPELIARAGQHRTPGFLPHSVRYRFLPCVLFAAATAAMFARMRLYYPLSVAWIAVFALLTLPRLFATVHTATNSSVAVSCLLLCWALFPAASQGLIGLASWIMVASIGALVDIRLLVLAPITGTSLFGHTAAERKKAFRAIAIRMACLLGVFMAVQLVLTFDPDFVHSRFHDDIVSRINIDLRGLGIELLGCPEWHLFFAAIGLWSAFRHYMQDSERLGLAILAIFTAVLLDGPARMVFIAPLAAIGAGRVLFRGTLTKPFRIPPPAWAIVLLIIATVRSAVIMTTRAPNWNDYQNRIGLLLDD